MSRRKEFKRKHMKYNRAKAIIRCVRLIRFYIRIVRIKKEEGHLVDALAIRGEEGRGTLRKVMGR